jgi:UDP-N-acetylmuramate--alanine ligase
MKNYFLVGIGGIGMSALAQLLKTRGDGVQGSDRDSSPTTDLLESKGIQVTFGHAALPEGIDVLVYSDAVPSDNPERASATESGIPQYSYFEMLGKVSRGMRTIAVAGTHGKTTVTGMLTKILVECGKSPTAVIGSIVSDFGSNFVQGKTQEDGSNWFVVEACEYKNHLLNLSPEVLVITNLELDHTDFFKSLDELHATFKKAIDAVPAHGYIVTDMGDENIMKLVAGAKATVVDYKKVTDVPELKLPGEFNRDNARAALATAQVAFPELMSPDLIGYAVQALADFKGSWRRFEYKGKLLNGTLVYDDYAHHPTAVRKTIEAAHAKWPDKKILVAFHPHLYSRTKQFMDEFATALATADEVVLAPIYAAREPHDPEVSSEILAAKIVALGTLATACNSLPEVLEVLTVNCKLSTVNSVLITMGAGDIYKVAEQLVHE